VEIQVRRAGPVDAPALARLRWQWRVDERSEVGDISRESFLTFFAEWAIDHFATHVPFLAEADGRIAGMAWLVLIDRPPSPARLDRRGAEIQSVYVIPELRGKGVGEALMAAIRRHANDRELGHLTVHSAKAAIGFYERLGFVHDEQWMAYPTEG
jgi:ribosomal protein S18 acetylase RimI-like enzyme